jgi:hypothetical protein
MKQDIENIIKKNLPEEKIISNIKFNSIQEDYSSGLLEGEILGHNQCLSQIPVSLIADEVLKVVVEEKYRLYKQLFDKINKMPMCIWHEKDELLDIIKISLCTDNKKAE